MRIQHVFIIGAKGFSYGGYETFLDKLTQLHQSCPEIKYHIACKANGTGYTDEKKLNGAKILSSTEYIYHNAHCFKIKAPKLGSAQAVFYDIRALKYCCYYIKKNNINHPIVYVLSSRIGPVMGYFAKKIHELGGSYFNNPDGWEHKRVKYSPLVRKYWKLSEHGMVKYSDLVICDSINIEQYIRKEYHKYNPQTTFIAYGSDITPSSLEDDDPRYVRWLKNHDLKNGAFYYSVGRFVPENNFETMIREFMKSKTDKDFVLITTKNDRFFSSLNKKLHFSEDKRIKFVGTVYDQKLLKKIRENAYGYFHGHEVGGTNPSLLEALGSTNLNLLLDVGFNREVAENAALYWDKKEGSLSRLIEEVDKMDLEAIKARGERAKKRIQDLYNWTYIANKYAQVFIDGHT